MAPVSRVPAERSARTRVFPRAAKRGSQFWSELACRYAPNNRDGLNEAIMQPLPALLFSNSSATTAGKVILNPRVRQIRRALSPTQFNSREIMVAGVPAYGSILSCFLLTFTPHTASSWNGVHGVRCGGGLGAPKAQQFTRIMTRATLTVPESADGTVEADSPKGAWISHRQLVALPARIADRARRGASWPAASSGPLASSVTGVVMGKMMRAAIATSFGRPLILSDLAIPLSRAGRSAGQGRRLRRVPHGFHAVDGDWPVKPTLPFVPGHEGAGSWPLGPGVTGLKEGDAVGIAWLHDACGACEHCRTGWETLCAASTTAATA